MKEEKKMRAQMEKREKSREASCLQFRCWLY